MIRCWNVHVSQTRLIDINSDTACWIRFLDIIRSRNVSINLWPATFFTNFIVLLEPFDGIQHLWFHVVCTVHPKSLLQVDHWWNTDARYFDAIEACDKRSDGRGEKRVDELLVWFHTLEQKWSIDCVPLDSEPGKNWAMKLHSVNTFLDAGCESSTRFSSCFSSSDSWLANPTHATWYLPFIL